MSTDEKQYLLGEMPESVPDGKILVHNKYKPTSTYNFRAWLQSPSDDRNLVICKCKWAPHLKHYRDKSRWSP
jgi:hypothetical protein